MADLLLGVKIGVQGGPQSVKEIKAIDDQVRKLQEQNARVAATAKALSESYNLNDVEVGQLVNKLQQLEDQTQETSQKAKDAAQEIGKQYNLSADQVAALAKRLDSINFNIDKDGKLRNAQGQFIKIKDEVAKLDGQLIQTSKSVKNLDSVFQGLLQGFGQQLTQIGKDAFVGAIEGVQSTIATASQAFGDFDKQLTLFSSKSGIAKDQLGELEEEAKRLAAVTTQSPASVAALATTLLTLGASAEESVERLEGIAKLSDVIGEDPVLTGRVVQTALTSYQAFGETADSVADKFKTLIDTTAAGSAGGIEEFLQFFQTAAPAATALGVSFDDLAAAFATARDAGASAEVASTGLKIAMLSLAKPVGAGAKAVEELKLQAFDAQGNFIGLQDALRQFNESTRNRTQQERVSLATDIFGREGAPVVLSLLSQVDQKYSQTLSNLQQSAGGVAEALEVINQELDGQRNLLEGDLEAAYTNLGEAFAPIELGLIKFTRGLITAVNEGGGGLDALNEAALRLSESLSNNPELVAQLGAALSQVGTALSQGIASQLDRITAALENNPELVQNLAQSFANGAQQVIEFAGAIGQIAGVLANLGANFAGAGASVFSSIAPTLISLVDVINAAVQALQPLLANTKLVEVAFQVLLVRMIALKAVGLANSFIGIATGLAGLVKGAFSATAAVTALNIAQATGSKSALLMAQSLAANGVAATTAAAGFKTAALAAAAATGPLIALTGAIATANLIKTTQELRFTNDELEAFANGVTVAGNVGIKFANDLNNVNDSIAAAGGRATAEQRKQLTDNVKLAKEQIASLQQELTNIQSIQPRNDSQRQSQQNLTQQVTTVIDSLNKQIGEAESTLSSAAGGLGDKTGKAVAGGIKGGLAGTPGEVAASIDGVSDAVGKEVDQTETELDRLSTANQQALSQLEIQAAQAQEALLKSGGDPAKLAQAEKTSLEQRITENKNFLESLKGLKGLEGEEAAKVADQIRQTELTLANDRVALARQVLDAKVKAAEEAAQKEVDALKKARDAEKEAATTQFEEEQTTRQDQFNDEERNRQKAFNKQQQNEERAFNESQRAVEEAFQKRQQAESKRFQAELDARRERGNREFDALGKEVDRRLQLQQASGSERAKLQEQFRKEDKAAKERRKIEQQVLNDRGRVLAGQGDLLELSPLEQARQQFEQGLQAEQEAFQLRQQEAERAFQEQQRIEAEAYQEQQILKQEEFDNREREIQRAFEAEQQAAEAAFNEQQRQLDEASAQRQSAILEAASRGIAPQVQARKDGGPVAAGQAYLVGEEGPELITPSRRGWVHTAGETAAMMSKQPTMLVKNPDMPGVEAKLSELLQEVRRGRRVAVPTSYTLNTVNPLQDAVALQIKQVRALARGRVL